MLLLNFLLDSIFIYLIMVHNRIKEAIQIIIVAMLGIKRL